MSVVQTRIGFSQAEANNDYIGLLLTEILVVTAALGVFSWSWEIFTYSFLGLAVLGVVPFLRWILAFGFIALWGFIGFQFGYTIGNINGAIVCTVVAVILSFGSHLMCFDSYKDISA